LVSFFRTIFLVSKGAVQHLKKWRKIKRKKKLENWGERDVSSPPFFFFLLGFFSAFPFTFIFIRNLKDPKRKKSFPSHLFFFFLINKKINGPNHNLTICFCILSFKKSTSKKKGAKWKLFTSSYQSRSFVKCSFFFFFFNFFFKWRVNPNFESPLKSFRKFTNYRQLKIPPIHFSY